MCRLDVKTVKKFKAVVVVTSTYGDGGAPESAERFENWLAKEPSNDIFRFVTSFSSFLFFPHPLLLLPLFFLINLVVFQWSELRSVVAGLVDVPLPLQIRFSRQPSFCCMSLLTSSPLLTLILISFVYLFV